ncbi:MAG: hypothetical protein QM582_05525 [Micropruina sp.]|uniref:hypothetical protein n=1 Tax=Micropruina sp. TaxID=2737536 RepID=UPI0039E33785
MTDDRPVIEVTIAAPVEAVWASLRDPVLIRRWHGWHYDGLDEEIAMIFGTEGADDEAHVLNANAGDRFEVDAVPGGTRVRVTRAPYLPDEAWSAYYDDITEGWKSFLQQLRFMHERHPGEDRRTIFLMARGEPDAPERLRGSVPARAGELWYAAERQRGVLLPDLGPGLLITVAKEPATDETGTSFVDASAIVTCYGLDDDQFAAEQARWTAWWASAYPETAPAPA